MQADYLLNLTFPHATLPKAANKVFSLMRLPHLIVFPFCPKQQTSKLQFPLTAYHACLAGMPRSTPRATQGEMQEQKHPAQETQPISSQNVPAKGHPCWSLSVQCDPHSWATSALKPWAAMTRAMKQKMPVFLHSCAPS